MPTHDLFHTGGFVNAPQKRYLMVNTVQQVLIFLTYLIFEGPLTKNNGCTDLLEAKEIDVQGFFYGTLALNEHFFLRTRRRSVFQSHPFV